MDGLGGVITPFDALGSGLVVGKLIEEVTLEEDSIYSISGNFKYVSVFVYDITCSSNTRLWINVNGLQTTFGQTSSGSTAKGYIICKSDDFVKIGFSSTGTWTNPLNQQMSRFRISGNIKNVSISLGSSPGESPLLAGTKITVYGIKEVQE